MSNRLINLLSNVLLPEKTFGIKRSTKWRNIRDSFLKDNPHCSFCDTVKDLQVHHVLPVHLYPQLELEIPNLMTLCPHCHFIIGHFCNWYSYNITVREDCEKFRERVKQRD